MQLSIMCYNCDNHVEIDIKIPPGVESDALGKCKCGSWVQVFIDSRGKYHIDGLWVSKA